LSEAKPSTQKNNNKNEDAMRNYIRARIGGGSYFFTLVAAARHGGPALTDRVPALRAAFRHVRQAHPFTVDAIVVLPDHLHCVWSLPPHDADYPMRWRLIKSCFSRSVPSGETVSPSRARRGERGIWQRRYWEHFIRDEPGQYEADWAASGDVRAWDLG
jgi:putative transposase